MKVLIATEKPFSAKAVDAISDALKNAGHDAILLERYNSKAELLKAVADADALIVRSDIVDAEVFQAAPSLKIVVRAGAGYDNIDLAAATAAGVVVENTPGQNSRAVAELVIGLAIYAARNHFNGTTGTELSGKRLGLQAFGQVSRNVATLASGFGMHISAFDPYCPAEVMTTNGVEPASSLSQLYANSDILSIHIPATAETKRSIGAELIGSLPKGAILVNTARKEVIDEEALAAVLRQRPDLKYVADVAPGNAAELVAEFGTRVYFTPKKTGAQTAEANMNAGVAAAHQISAYFADGTDKFRVN